MSAGAALRRGWCPGALTPMASGDGLIVRLRFVGSALTPAQARAIAWAATEFGNGHIDLTARANLQIRGVSERTLLGLQSVLETLGLIDADPSAEAVRNIVASPLAGLDPDALLDIRPLIAALDQRLRQDRVLWRLPGKFGFAIDDGGRLTVANEPADVAFIAEPDVNGEVRFSLRLAGSAVGHCGVAELTESAARLASAFLHLRGSGEMAARRMAGLVDRTGIAPILRAAGLAANPGSEAPTKFRSQYEAHLLGVHHLGERHAFGVGEPFGRLDSQKLAALADAAEIAAGELRLTPWRAVLIVGDTIDPTLAARLRDAGFALDDEDPIRAVAACPGAPACISASTPTQSDARRVAAFAHQLARGIALHVSGCAKGCAHAAPAPVVAIGRDGRYDLVLEGRAGDTPALNDVTAEELDLIIERLAETPRADRAAALRAFTRAAT